MEGQMSNMQNQQGAPPQGAPQQQEKLTPQQEKMKLEIEKNAALYMKVLHGKKSRNKIYDILKAAPAEQSIPQAAMVVMQIVDKNTPESHNPPPEVMFGSGAYLIQDLIEICNAGGFGIEEPIGPAQGQEIMMRTMQKYIEYAIPNGKLDPIQLQQAVEPLLNDQQREMGTQAAQQVGISMQPGTSHAMETYANQRVAGEKARFQAELKKAQAKQGGGAMQQAAQQPQQPQQRAPQGGQR